MDAQTLSGGFTNPPIQSAHIFRSVMQAMARPGAVQEVAGVAPPEPLSQSAGAVLLTLCDAETPIYLAGGVDCDAVRSWIAFHTGAPLVGPEQAMFAVGRWAELAPVSAYPIGTSEYPDRSATLIVEQDELKTGARLKGPGIKDTAGLNIPGVAAFQANHKLFPLGMDFIFTCGDQLAALPRTTEVA